MRRKDREIENQNEIMEIIKRCRVCSLAFSGEDYPYVIPINFGVGAKDGKTVFYFHGAGKAPSLTGSNAITGSHSPCMQRKSWC